MSTTNPGTGNQGRAVWLAIIVLAAVIAANLAWSLLVLAGATAVIALSGAGATFAAVMTVGIAMRKFLDGN